MKIAAINECFPRQIRKNIILSHSHCLLFFFIVPKVYSQVPFFQQINIKRWKKVVSFLFVFLVFFPLSFGCFQDSSRVSCLPCQLSFSMLMMSRINEDCYRELILYVSLILYERHSEWHSYSTPLTYVGISHSSFTLSSHYFITSYGGKEYWNVGYDDHTKRFLISYWHMS